MNSSICLQRNELTLYYYSLLTRERLIIILDSSRIAALSTGLFVRLLHRRRKYDMLHQPISPIMHLWRYNFGYNFFQEIPNSLSNLGDPHPSLFGLPLPSST